MGTSDAALQLKYWIGGWRRRFFTALPLYLTFFVTGRCNASCPQCFYAEHNSPDTFDDELSADEIDRFTKTLGVLPVLLLSGGEPTLREDLPDIISSFYRNAGTRHVTLPTNALLPERTEHMVSRILRECPDIRFCAQLSVDDTGARHDRIKGVDGAFERLMETYGRLAGLSERHPGLSLALCFTFSAFNQDRAPEVFRELARSSSCYNLRMVLTRGSSRDPAAVEWDADTFERAVDAMFEVMERAPARRTIDRALLLARQRIAEDTIIRTVKENRLQARCLAGRINAILDEFGNVYPCELRWEPMGNIRETGYELEPVWKSKKAEEIRRGIIHDGCFCTHETNVITNISFVARHLPGVAAGMIGNLAGRK